MDVAEHILAYALVGSVLLGLEEEVILSMLVLHDVGVDGRRMEVEEHLWRGGEVGEVVVGVCPIHAVVWYRAIVGEQREVDHELARLLVVDGLRRPHAGDVGKVGAGISLREMHGVVLPMHKVTRLHEHQPAVARPAERGAHVCGHHEIFATGGAQYVGVAHATGAGDGVGGHDGTATVERRVVEAVVAHGIGYLLLLWSVAREIDEEVLVARACRHGSGNEQHEREKRD